MPRHRVSYSSSFFPELSENWSCGSDRVRDVQDFAGHRDARTTRRYDRTREDLDRSATYALAGWLADRGDRAQT